jgi:hypothetical protein
MAEQIDKAHLAGLKFRGSKVKKIEKDGRKMTAYEPYERPLQPADVLAFVETATSVTLVTADGQKLTVEKKAEKK